MKKLLTLFAVAGFVCAVSAMSHAGSGHDHDHERAGGPKGGRLLEGTRPLAEFFVEKDKTVTVAFYDDALKPVAAGEQTATVIADSEGDKSTLEFEKQGDVLISKGGLPEAHALNLVVRFKQTASAKPLNFRFIYEDHVCDTCGRAEYACICGH